MPKKGDLPNENEQRDICGKEPNELGVTGWHTKFGANVNPIDWSRFLNPML